MNDELEQVQQDYLASLQDLTFNSRPIISNLTIIAQENVQAAEVIVKAIETHIAKPHKLYGLYLLDSISKNVGAPYTTYFGRNLFKTFTETYTLVTEPTRQKLYDLFQTWKQVSPITGTALFSPEPIKKIESFLSSVRARREQSASAPPSSSISQRSLLTKVEQLLDLTNQRRARDSSDQDAQSQAVILDKLRNILSSQTLPAQMLPSIERQLSTFAEKEQRRLQRSGQPQQPYLQQQQQQQPQQPYPQQQTQSFNAAAISSSLASLSSLTNPSSSYPSSGYYSGQRPSQNQTYVSQPNIQSVQPQQSPAVSDLISKLQTSGLLNIVKTPTPSISGTPVPASLSLSSTSSLVELTNADLNKPRPDLISKLYQDIPSQCHSCGKRFAANQQKIKEIHLDWHFRVNRKLLESVGSQNRCWYLDCESWISFKDEEEILGFIDSNDESNKPQDSSNKKPSSSSSSGQEIDAADALKHKVPIPQEKHLAKLPCPICQEKFETGWDDNTESWMWTNAINDRGRIFHYTCHQEVSKSGGGLLKRIFAQDRAKSSTPDIASGPVKRKFQDDDGFASGGDKKRALTTA